MPTAAELKTQLVAARAAARAAKAEADSLAAAAAKAERDERRAKEAAENAAHFNRMHDEIGQPLAGLNPGQHAIVYSMAWEQGHSSGYEEVEMYYGEFAEMARKIIEAN